MLVNRRTRSVEWGDCDPAGIVFFPRYFAFFDAGTHELFALAGAPTQELTATYGIVGCPLVDVQARFMVPSRFSDELIIESSIREWRRRTFVVQHRVYKGDTLAVEGSEIRAWVACAAGDPGKMQAQNIPQEVIARFGTMAAAG